MVIHATGKSGTEVVRQLGSAPNHPSIYGMTRNMLEVPREFMKVHRKHTEMLIEGDVATPTDLHRALLISHADTIVLAVDNNIYDDDDVAPAAVRAENERAEAAKSIATVLRHPPFRKIRLIVLSLSRADSERGNNNTSNNFSRRIFGLRQSVEARRHQIILDHEAHEQVLLSDHTIQTRTTIIRTHYSLTMGGTRAPSSHHVSLGKMHQKLQYMRRQADKRNHHNNQVYAVSPELGNLASYLVDEVAHGRNQGLVVSVPMGEPISKPLCVLNNKQ